MQKITPSQNFSISIHQATILTPISSLLLSPQVQIDYGSVQIRTKSSSETLPQFNETFNLELSLEVLNLSLFNNPKFFKESLIGTCQVPVKTHTCWYSLYKNSEKVASIRLSIHKDSDQSHQGKLYQEKLSEAKKIQNEVKALKTMFLDKVKELKEKNFTRRETLENIENSDLTQRSLCNKQEFKELINRKAMIKIQEEHFEQERAKIQEAWKEIENEKRDMEKAICRIKEGVQETQVAKLRNNIVNRINEYSRNRGSTPKSAKFHQGRNSEVNLIRISNEE